MSWPNRPTESEIGYIVGPSSTVEHTHQVELAVDIAEQVIVEFVRRPITVTGQVDYQVIFGSGSGRIDLPWKLENVEVKVDGQPYTDYRMMGPIIDVGGSDTTRFVEITGTAGEWTATEASVISRIWRDAAARIAQRLRDGTYAYEGVPDDVGEVQEALTEEDRRQLWALRW